MNKKLKAILIIILTLAIVAGIIVTAVIGLNFGLIYDKHKTIDITIGKEFEENDIKQIVKEVTGKSEIIVETVELYEDMVSIHIREITDEQIEEINNKINEKYELENTVDKNIKINQYSHVRASDLIKPYIMPVTLSVVCVLIYFIIYLFIKYRNENKVEILKNIANIILSIVYVQLLYLSLLAIARIPINRLTIPIGLTLYIATVTFKMYKLDKISK